MRTPFLPPIVAVAVAAATVLGVLLARTDRAEALIDVSGLWNIIIAGDVSDTCIAADSQANSDLSVQIQCSGLGTGSLTGTINTTTGDFSLSGTVGGFPVSFVNGTTDGNTMSGDWVSSSLSGTFSGTIKLAGGDDVMESRGKFQMLVSPEFRGLMAGYPGYDGISKLDSPDLYDPNTLVGRSVYHVDGDATDSGGALVGTSGTIISDSDFSLVPDGFEGPPGTREVHTEIRSMNLTALGGLVAVRAGTDAPGQPMSPGEVESQSASGNPVDDFPADSFFDVFVEVDLPGLFDFPGGTLYNADPLLVFNNNVTTLPPRVVYVHGNSSAVPVFFKDDNLPDWEAGDLFGWLTLAGHGAGFDDSPEDIAEFEQIYEEEVESDPLPVPDGDGGGAPDDLELAKAGDLGNSADDAAILALDNDGDGCSNGREMGANEVLGGQRDYFNPWDYFDTNGDQYIDLPNDILGVILRYTAGGGVYDANYDRGPSTGPNAWNMTAPDGTIDLPNDILGVIMQYQHDCR